MINNRQNGRRRGRGGQGAPRPNGSNGGQDRGNRIDNRARGNAAQLLEKYKALARDAQMQGDRVNTEYYLQFADHYFRVLSESRSRFEEQQPRPRRDDFNAQSDDDYGDEGERIGDDQQQGVVDQNYQMQDRDDQRDYRSNRAADDRGDDHRSDGNRSDGNRTDGHRNDGHRGDGNRSEGPRDDSQRADGPRGDGPRGEERRPRRGRPERGERRLDTVETPVEAAPESAPPPPRSDDGGEPQVRRRGRPPKAQPVDQLDANILPPSLSLQAPVNDGDDDGARPRTRTRKPRGESAAA